MFKGHLIGHLGQDAAIGVTQKGTDYAAFSVACKTGYGQNEATTWVDCILAGKNNVANYLKKGTHIYVEGDLTIGEYKGKPKANISVKNLKLLSKKDDR